MVQRHMTFALFLTNIFVDLPTLTLVFQNTSFCHVSLIDLPACFYHMSIHMVSASLWLCTTFVRIIASYGCRVFIGKTFLFVDIWGYWWLLSTTKCSHIISLNSGEYLRGMGEGGYFAGQWTTRCWQPKAPGKGGEICGSISQVWGGRKVVGMNSDCEAWVRIVSRRIKFAQMGGYWRTQSLEFFFFN